MRRLRHRTEARQGRTRSLCRARMRGMDAEPADDRAAVEERYLRLVRS